MKTIFIVDDSDVNLSVAEEALENHYRVMTLPSAAKMFALLEKITPDLILLDIFMPEMDGFTALKKLKENPNNATIPVIFLTGQTDSSAEAKGFILGAVDFITKPFSAAVLLNRIKMHLNIDDLIKERTKQLEHKISQVENLYNDIISILADVVESRDLLTGSHIERVRALIEILINAMIERGVYSEEISTWNSNFVASSARLHDVGKIIVPDNILNKPGRLTPEEFEIMKKHVIAGEEIIDKIMSKTHEDKFWNWARIFTSYHHERWDGTGYPHNLKGEEIPLQGRILALVDVYDALVSKRVYKAPIPHKQAVEIIMADSGKHFDPKIANVFFEINEKFAAKNEEQNSI